MLSIGLLGAGRIGTLHGRNIAATPRPGSPPSRMPWRRPPRRSGANSARRCAASRTIIADPAIEALLICSSTDTHADLIEAGARAGKAVFCEKPVDLCSERIRACLEVVEAAGTPLMIGFNRRFDPHFAALQQRLAEGEIGEVELVDHPVARSRAPADRLYRALGRPVPGHDDPRLRHGALPARRGARRGACGRLGAGRSGDRRGRRRRHRGGPAKTASGKICQISNSRRATYGYDQRVEVHGSKGMIRAHNMLEIAVETATPTGFRAAPVLNFFLERYIPAYRRELDHFLDCVAKGKAPSPTGEDGLRAQILADAATLSAQTGRPQHV